MSKTPRGLRLRSFPAVAPVTAVAFLFLYLPMAAVVVYSFNAGKTVLIWEGFSLRWFAAVFQDNRLIAAAVNSLVVACAAMLVATVLAITFALAIDRWARRNRTWANWLIMAPLVVPEIVTAVALLSLISLIGLPPGLPAIVLAHITFCIPFALMPIRARLQTINPAVFEAAADLGADQATMMRRITVPLLVPGIVSGALLAFVISLDDVIISNFLSAPGSTTLPVYVFGMMRLGISPIITAIGTMLIALSTIVIVFSYIASKRGKK
ncbi:MAG: ABC transporter permease [Mycobacterium sp.]